LKSDQKKASDKKEENDEQMLRTIEDLRSEVRELRTMVNMLVEIIASIESPDDMDLDLDTNMMDYDSLFKSGKYCM
jgi:hypothetical protein